MPLEWLSTPIDPGAVGDFLARKRHRKAIEALKAKLRDLRAPSPHIRLQLVDLLILAGRVKEAVPILLGLADEFAADGFVAKAIAILKRVEKVEPGREDVQEKLSHLVNEQLRLAPTLSVPMRMPAVPGLERIREVDEPPEEGPLPQPKPREDVVSARLAPLELEAEERPSLPAEPGPTPELHEEVPSPTPSGGEGVPTTGVSAPDGEPPGTSEPGGGVAETTPSETAAEPEAGKVVPETGPGVRERIRAVFRRFLATLPGGVEAVPDSSLAHDGTPPEAEEPPSGEPAPGGELAAAASVDSADAPSDVAQLSSASEAERLLESALAADAAEPLSDEAFESQLLDLVEDVLMRPPEPVPESAARPKPSKELGSRLVASPLFSGLSQDELLAVVRGLGLHTFEPGDIIVSEGEPGQSLFILASGRARVFVRSSSGRSLQVATLDEGDFFGEITCLSGGPRTATVTAAAPCEMLELDKTALDAIATAHPGVRRRLEDSYVERASSREAATVRAARLAEPGTRERAVEALTAHFGDRRWDPRMRLRLADVLLRAGKDEEAVPILAGLADELTREGFTEKAIAILKKIEKIQSRHIEEVSLAPLVRPELEGIEPASSAPGARREPGVPPTATAPAEPFQSWLVELVRETVGPGAPGSPPAVEVTGAARAYAPGLAASPLFEGLSEDELLAILKGLRLLSFAPGDIIVTEGEPGQSVFILAEGSVNVCVRDPAGHDAHLCRLDEGAFFGEISTLSGRPRSATVTAASRCELLELDPPSLDRVASRYPSVRTVLEDYSARRALSPEAARIRQAPPEDAGG